MPFVGNRNAIDGVIRISLDNGTRAVYWAGALVANTCDRNASDGKCVALTLVTLPPWLVGSFKRLILGILVLLSTRMELGRHSSTIV